MIPNSVLLFSFITVVCGLLLLAIILSPDVDEATAKVFRSPRVPENLFIITFFMGLVTCLHLLSWWVWNLA